VSPAARRARRAGSGRALLLTCEHGGNRVPPAFAALFRGRGARALLDSHRGFDPGALDAARRLARATGAPLLAATTTRLLVDPNRSATNPAVFSARTRGLPRAEREALLARFHAPHRRRVREAIDRLARPGRGVLHVAVHSFTPRLRGERRDFDLGLLYDPARPPERALARRWVERLAAAAPTLRVRRNAPYRGASDGLTTALRRELGPGYLGIELELSQAALADRERRAALLAALADRLREECGRR